MDRGLSYHAGSGALPVLSKEDFSALHYGSMRELDIARAILAGQYACVLSGKHRVLYHELRVYDSHDEWDPVAHAARAAVNLDLGPCAQQHLECVRAETGNWGSVLHGPYDASQRRREKEWAELIVGDGWLLCGRDHAQNGWGLLDLLRAKGASLETAFSCQQYEAELGLLRAERSEIMARAWASRTFP